MPSLPLRAINSVSKKHFMLKTDKFKSIRCPLCHKDNFQIVYTAKFEDINRSFDYLTETPAHYQIVRCKTCQMLYSNPIFQEEAILSLYRHASVENCVNDEEQRSIQINMQRYLGRLIHLSGITAGTLLDIGCGAGYLLNYAKQVGFDIHGVEPNKDAARFSCRLTGVNSILNGVYDRNLYSPETFDLITLIHVIDHVVSPKTLLENIFYHLKPDGYLIVATHNISSLLAHLTKENFIAYSIQHISYFTPDTLRTLLGHCGFEHTKTFGSVTTYSLKHFADNGIRNRKWRRVVINLMEKLKIHNKCLSFPFGNMEIIVKKT